MDRNDEVISRIAYERLSEDISNEEKWSRAEAKVNYGTYLWNKFAAEHPRGDHKVAYLGGYLICNSCNVQMGVKL